MTLDQMIKNKVVRDCCHYTASQHETCRCKDCVGIRIENFLLGRIPWDDADKDLREMLRREYE